MADGTLSGIIDDRGKFIYITMEELQSVAKFMKQRGRVSIQELAESSNRLITLTPTISTSSWLQISSAPSVYSCRPTLLVCLISMSMSSPGLSHLYVLPLTLFLSFLYSSFLSWFVSSLCSSPLLVPLIPLSTVSWFVSLLCSSLPSFLVLPSFSLPTLLNNSSSSCCIA